jgi:hypothetical protein
MRQRDVVIVIMLTVASASCVASRHEAISLRAIQRFHEQFNNSQFAEIYDGADEKTKEKISKGDFVEDMKAMRRGQGAVLQSEEMAIDYNYVEGISLVKIAVRVSFEKGVAREKFIYYMRDNRAQLASYRFLGP